MAKRELIEREKLINELTESSKHHAQTSREESLLYRDRQIVREQPTITEQEIVKPYLDKIRAEINKLTVYYTTKDKGINLISQTAVNRIFDRYKAESEGEEWTR